MKITDTNLLNSITQIGPGHLFTYSKGGIAGEGIYLATEWDGHGRLDAFRVYHPRFVGRSETFFTRESDRKLTFSLVTGLARS